MTGFAKVSGEGHGARWSLEARSVNHRHLDLRLRFPGGFEDLEETVRRAAARRFARGAIQLSLALEREQEALEPVVNMELLQQLAAAADTAAVKLGRPAPTLDTLFCVRGVVEMRERASAEDAEQALKAAIEADFHRLFDELARARAGEGARLGDLAKAQLDEIARLNEAAGQLAASQPQAIFERLRTAVEQLVSANGGLDAARLHQEAALLAAKADVREELDRLASHVAEGRAILAEGSPAGRRLDFLAQEFNREANTLCSKSSDAELTKIGLGLKLVIDQMREQVQNIE